MLIILLPVSFPWLALLHPFCYVVALSMMQDIQVMTIIVWHAFPTQSAGDILADVVQHFGDVLPQIASLRVDLIVSAHLVAVAQQPDAILGLRKHVQALNQPAMNLPL